MSYCRCSRLVILIPLDKCSCCVGALHFVVCLKFKDVNDIYFDTVLRIQMKR